jgi:putative ABC transport system ATP-binding protein
VDKRLVMSVKDVVKTFGDGPTAVSAIRGVDLDVYSSEVILIMGPSGSGKTTLLSIMGALMKPTSGEVWLESQEITALSESRLPDLRLRRLGFVFQDFNLLSSLTALENVEVVLGLAGVRGRDARERAERLLRDLGLGERLRHRPSDLSGGEKQRVSVARALANEPAVLLCDEPTANLDSKIGHDIIARLRAIADGQDRSVVIVSHDDRIRPHADRVLWLEDGRFKEMAAMDVDPVCGMSIERDKAAATLEYGGRTYYFCSVGCKREFEEKIAKGEVPKA